MGCPNCIDPSYKKVGHGVDLYKCDFCGYEAIEHVDELQEEEEEALDE